MLEMMLCLKPVALAWRARAALAVVCSGMCLPAWSGEPGYIDAAQCAGCHREAAEGYARSGIARSFGVARAGTKAAQAPPGQFHHAASEQDFVVSRRNGKLYLRRSLRGHDGKPADVLEAAAAAVWWNYR
jgi:hypothetical protein